MSEKRGDSEEALRSALGRLKVAIFGVEQNLLRPYNERASQLLATEALREDVLAQRPSHPLSAHIASIFDGTVAAGSSIVTFPSGTAYRVEASQPSIKGRDRILMLFLEPAHQRSELALDRWNFTPRERQIAEQILCGASSDEMCERLQMSSETLKTHLRKMFQRTNTRNRTELVAKILGQN